MSKVEPNANQCPIQEPSVISHIEDVYICVFFDGTGNNMFEQENKKKHLEEKLKKIKSFVSVKFSIIDGLFSFNTPDSKYNSNLSDLKQYGMKDYKAQKEQAEWDYKIQDFNDAENRTDKDDLRNNGGWKYSNIAVLRSLVGKKKVGDESGQGKTRIAYNLYIEGSGKNWDRRNSVIGLGMGTGRTGVVGLVSKAVVFVREYLCSNIEKELRDKVNLHFAVFGFSRGATCSRLFSSLIVKGKEECLGHEAEFEQYLPLSENYFKNGRVSFLDDFNDDKKTVDFLGIYDTVSSIGFLQKKDNSTNYKLNNYQESPKDEFGKYIGVIDSNSESNYQGSHKENADNDSCNNKSNKAPSWYINSLHGSVIKEDDVLEIDTPMGPIPSPKVLGTYITDKSWGDAKWNFHRFNVLNYGLDPYKNKKVKHTFHICAIDEFRENFALVDLGDGMSENHCTEIYMPGCHSDIGGSYMYNDEIEEHTLRRIIGKKGLSTHLISSSDPRDFGISAPLSQHVLYDLGWINSKTRTFSTYQQIEIPSFLGPLIGNREVIMEETKYKKELNDQNADTGGQTTYINQKTDVIDFKHFSKEGYSNISLEMMLERAKGKNGLIEWNEYIPFTREIPKRFKINWDACLGNLKTKFESAKNVVEGGRFWIIPENKEDYVDLRNNYLHFTCTDKLHQVEDIGNAPNWVSNVLLKEKEEKITHYVLCRLVYRGNNNDYDLHYWNEPIFKNDKII